MSRESRYCPTGVRQDVLQFGIAPNGGLQEFDAHPDQEAKDENRAITSQDWRRIRHAVFAAQSLCRE